MAPHPFTTIDPNVGYCLVPAPIGSCPEEDISSNEEKNKVACTHGRDSFGRRLIPVLLKDVAGLVPGAYQGRGRGNKVRSRKTEFLFQMLLFDLQLKFLQISIALYIYHSFSMISQMLTS